MQNVWVRLTANSAVRMMAISNVLRLAAERRIKVSHTPTTRASEQFAILGSRRKREDGDPKGFGAWSSRTIRTECVITHREDSLEKGRYSLLKSQHNGGGRVKLYSL